MLSCKPRRHAKMINVGMCDDRVRHARCFVWITRRIGRCEPIVQEKFGPGWVLHHDTNVSDFTATSKAMETETLLGRDGWIRRSSTWIVHHHVLWTMLLSMNLWTPTPWFPMEHISGLETNISSGFGQEHHRLHSTYLPMASSMRHSSSCFFAALPHNDLFQWK